VYRICIETQKTQYQNTLIGAVAIVLSILVFMHPGMTVVSIIYLLGIILIIVGIEKIIGGIFVANKSRWGTVGLVVLALIFGSIAVGYPVSTAVLVIFMLGFGLLFIGISHIVNGLGNKEGPGWARGFSGAGPLAIALSFLVMASPYAGAVFVSVFLGLALLIIGIEIIVVGSTVEEECQWSPLVVNNPSLFIFFNSSPCSLCHKSRRWA
jgi:uncharacterized membrane protein HdeD (DUF308 family)